MLSTGFDAAKGDVGNAKHGRTTQMGLDLLPDDYAWVTERVQEVADLCCDGRVVSVLEGGYGSPLQQPKPQRVTRQQAAAKSTSAGGGATAGAAAAAALDDDDAESSVASASSTPTPAPSAGDLNRVRKEQRGSRTRRGAEWERSTHTSSAKPGATEAPAHLAPVFIDAPVFSSFLLLPFFPLRSYLLYRRMTAVAPFCPSVSHTYSKHHLGAAPLLGARRRKESISLNAIAHLAALVDPYRRVLDSRGEGATGATGAATAASAASSNGKAKDRERTTSTRGGKEK